MPNGYQAGKRENHNDDWLPPGFVGVCPRRSCWKSQIPSFDNSHSSMLCIGSSVPINWSNIPLRFMYLSVEPFGLPLYECLVTFIVSEFQ